MWNWFSLRNSFRQHGQKRVKSLPYSSGNFTLLHLSTRDIRKTSKCIILVKWITLKSAISTTRVFFRKSCFPAVCSKSILKTLQFLHCWRWTGQWTTKFAENHSDCQKIMTLCNTSRRSLKQKREINNREVNGHWAIKLCLYNWFLQPFCKPSASCTLIGFLCSAN